MDNSAFAGLVVSIIVNENRITGKQPLPSAILENGAAWCGIIVSGHLIYDTYKANNWSQIARYVSNEDVSELATVGIGNVKLDTAANLWKGRACGHPLVSPECTPVEVSPLRGTNALGIEINLPNPYQGTACAPGGVCANYERTDDETYKYLASQQLLSHENNIEYVAANLEAGALRAQARGIHPSAFNLATWHMWGVNSRSEVRDMMTLDPRNSPGPYGPMGVVKNIPTALRVLGLTSSWTSSMDAEFLYWQGQGY